jgi:hypothetical protein
MKRQTYMKMKNWDKKQVHPITGHESPEEE